MYTLQVFRTKSKDHLEAFSKMEEFVKSYNSNVGSSISKESTNKIHSKLNSLVDDNLPDPKKYTSIETPYDGKSVEDFKNYLSKFIKEYHFGYSSELDNLAEELDDIDEDEEAEILREINWEMEDYIESISDGNTAISVRIFGCISQENKVFGYSSEGETSDLKPNEWSISVLEKLFSDESDKKNFDIFSDTWEVTWIETSLFDLDDENGLVVSNDQNIFFIIVYIKEAD